MSLRLSGINPLAYMGVEPLTPPALLVRTAVPTANDAQNINIGSFWLVESPMELWYLAALTQGQATWLQLYPTGGSSTEFVCNTGSATTSSGILNLVGDGVSITTAGAGNTVTISVLGEVETSFHADTGTATPAGGVTIMAGGTNMNTSASGNTVTFNLDNSVSLAGTLGVTGNTTLSSALILSAQGAGVVQTNSSGVVTSSNGTNGQVLIGGGTAPAWRNLTAGSNITITNSANSIVIASSVAGGAVAFSAYNPTDTMVSAVTIYPYGSLTPMTVEFNLGGAFYPGDGLGTPASFTAPIDGYYTFNMISEIQSLASGSPLTALIASIVGPANTYTRKHFDSQTGAGGASQASVSVSATIALNASDVVTFTVSNGTAIGNYRVRGPLVYPPSATPAINNLITGFLVSEF